MTAIKPEPRYSYKEVMIAGNNGGPIKVGPVPDKTGWSDKFEWTIGGCYADVQSTTPEQLKQRVLSDFVGVVVRYQVPVEQAHESFMLVKEYQQAIPRGMAHGESELDF